MGTNKQIVKQISGIKQLTTAEGTDIEQKLDELVALLEHADIDSEKIKRYKAKFNAAFEKAPLEAFKELDNESMSRDDLLNNLGRLLEEHPVDSRITAEIVKRSTTKRIVLGLIGLVMITLGFAMIIMPAPPYFEMFTIFYFSNDDGVTIMDLISLVIVLCGVYLLIMSIIRHKKGI